MKPYSSAVILACLLLFQSSYYMVLCQGGNAALAAALAQKALQENKPVGAGGGSYQPGKNWQAGGTLGLGAKVWESRNQRHSVGVGAAATQYRGRYEGYNWKTKPDIGVGVGYQYKFGK